MNYEIMDPAEQYQDDVTTRQNELCSIGEAFYPFTPDNVAESFAQAPESFIKGIAAHFAYDDPCFAGLEIQKYLADYWFAESRKTAERDVKEYNFMRGE